jgi:glycine/D-amino acid oxidase-like deaminating enzyme
MVNNTTRLLAGTREKVVGTIRKQLISDPQLPHQTPTTALWQLPIAEDIGGIQSSHLPEKVDYAIIGTGVAGCGVTRSILTNSRSGSTTVGVFEARGLCSGATGRNGGQLTRLPPTRHTFMVEEFGTEQANKIMRLTVRGLQEMHSLAESQGPDFLAATKKTHTEKFFAYFDQESWTETVEAVKLFETEVPEEKGAYELVSKEETAAVRSGPDCPLFRC